MKCPVCQREMKKGFLHNSNQPVQWIPEGSKPSIWKTGVANDSVILGGEFSWTGYRAEAWFCHACQLVIASTAE